MYWIRHKSKLVRCYSAINDRIVWCQLCAVSLIGCSACMHWKLNMQHFTIEHEHANRIDSDFWVLLKSEHPLFCLHMINKCWVIVSFMLVQLRSLNCSERNYTELILVLRLNFDTNMIQFWAMKMHTPQTCRSFWVTDIASWERWQHVSPRDNPFVTSLYC